MKRTKVNKKRPGLAHLKKEFLPQGPANSTTRALIGLRRLHGGCCDMGRASGSGPPGLA